MHSSLSPVLSLTKLIAIISLTALSSHLCIGRQLTQQDFDDIIGSDYYLFIKYFAPWCGHCQKLAPIWDKLEAKILSYQTSRVIIAKVDCTEERDLCSRESVMGYPTLKLYKSRDSNGIEYEGERDLFSLETYLRAQLGDEVVDGTDDSSEAKSSDKPINVPKPINGLHELNDENIEEFLSKGRHFVKFYAPWCGHCQRLAPTWDQLAESFQFDTSVKISKIDCTVNSLSCKHYEIKGYPTLLWIVDGKVVDKYSGTRSHEDLKQFATDKKREENTEKVTLDLNLDLEDYGPVIVTDQNFAKTINKGITFVKYMVPWCTRSKNLKPIWNQLATKFFGHNNVKIAKVDCAQYESLCNKQQVDGYPTLLLYKDNERISEYEGEKTLEELHEFVLKHSAVPEKDEL